MFILSYFSVEFIRNKLEISYNLRHLSTKQVTANISLTVYWGGGGRIRNILFQVWEPRWDTGKLNSLYLHLSYFLKPTQKHSLLSSFDVIIRIRVFSFFQLCFILLFLQILLVKTLKVQCISPAIITTLLFPSSNNSQLLTLSNTATKDKEYWTGIKSGIAKAPPLATGVGICFVPGSTPML